MQIGGSTCKNIDFVAAARAKFFSGTKNSAGKLFAVNRTVSVLVSPPGRPLLHICAGETDFKSGSALLRRVYVYLSERVEFLCDAHLAGRKRVFQLFCAVPG